MDPKFLRNQRFAKKGLKKAQEGGQKTQQKKALEQKKTPEQKSEQKK